MNKRISNRQMLRHIDWLLLSIVILLVLLGMVAVASATSAMPEVGEGETLTFSQIWDSIDFQYAELQIMFFVVGLVAVAVILIMDYNNLREYSNIIYWISVALLVAVWLFGREINGTSGWFIIGGRGFQPAEICKIALIIVISKELAKRTEPADDGIKSFKEILPVLWRFAIPFVLIMAQPDWGTAFVYLFIFAGLLFISKTSWKIIGGMLAGAAACIPLLWIIMADWQKERVYNLFDPTRDAQGTGLNVIRAKIVGGSGGINGKGLFSSGLLTQQANYLPEKHTDFIFSATIEAVGFIGGLILLLLYFLLLLRLVQISMRAKDHFGSYIVIGVACMILYHVFENVGMNIGLMPVTGIPLPLFSYGGSNVLTVMIAIGLCVNVNMRRQRWST